MALNNKELEIARALVFYIRKKYPNEKPVKIGKLLNIKPSNLSRLLHLQALPSLHKIIEIEDALKMDVIKAVSIEGQTFDQEITTQPERIGSQFHQIINDPNYSQKFGFLLENLEKAFKGLVNNANLYFKIRKKERYVSINLVPVGLESGGHHLIMFRYSQSNHILNIEFVIGKYDQFKEYLLQFVDYIETINEKRKAVDILKLKKSHCLIKLYLREDEHPSIVYSRPMVDEDLTLIVDLAMWVYNNKK